MIRNEPADGAANQPIVLLEEHFKRSRIALFEATQQIVRYVLVFLHLKKASKNKSGNINKSRASPHSSFDRLLKKAEVYLLDSGKSQDKLKQWVFPNPQIAVTSI